MLLQANGIVPSRLPIGFVPVDIDVTPFDNSKTKKEQKFAQIGQYLHRIEYIDLYIL